MELGEARAAALSSHARISGVTRMTTTTAVKPTPEQLAIIGSLERRARSAQLEIEEVQLALEKLAAEGVLAAERMDLSRSAEELQADLDDLHGLRVVQGLDAFYDWWFYRLRMRETLTTFAIDVMDDRDRIAQLRAVDRTIAQAAPEIVEILNELCAARRLETDPADVLATIRAGMTIDEFTASAEAAITKLIESGWRP